MKLTFKELFTAVQLSDLCPLRIIVENGNDPDEYFFTPWEWDAGAVEEECPEIADYWVMMLGCDESTMEVYLTPRA